MSLPLRHPDPAERVAVICFGFAADRIRRQPWHTAHGIASGCAAQGCGTALFTDAAGPPAPALYAVERVPSLFAGGRPSAALRDAIAAFAPTRIFLICGAVRLARLGPLDLGAPVTLVMTSPRLRRAELARLAPWSWWREWDVLRGPLIDALLPGPVLRRGFERSGAAGVLYLSAAAQSRYGAAGLPPGRLLAPQVEPLRLPPAPRAVPPRIVYLGPALELRGAWLAVDAFERLARAGVEAELLLLLRPDSGRASLLRLLRRVRRSPVRPRIRCRTRMLSPEALRDQLAGCHVFLLPFKAPVSEAPLVVIEAGLSGRPVVVLDAPGVSEYAQILGGLVARVPDELPELLIRACLIHTLRPRDPRPWTRWDEALAPILAAPADPRPRCRFLGLVGVDGSGKTYLLECLCRELETAGVPHRRVWSRFRNYLSKPLLALTRLTGHNVKVEHGDVRIGYHEFHRSRPLALLFLALQAVDQVLDILLRYRLRHRTLIVGDRCVLDTLVDLAVDTGLDDLVIDRLGPLLLALLPRPWLAVVVVRPVGLIRESRPDALLDRNFMRRRALYERLAARFGLPVIENGSAAEPVIADVLRLARGPASAAGASP